MPEQQSQKNTGRRVRGIRENVYILAAEINSKERIEGAGEESHAFFLSFRHEEKREDLTQKRKNSYVNGHHLEHEGRK